MLLMVMFDEGQTDFRSVLKVTQFKKGDINSQKETMVASAIFLTDLSGKSIISRNYRGDVPLTKAIERFANYLNEVEDEAKKPVFQMDMNGDVLATDEVGGTGPGGETYVYVNVRTKLSKIRFSTMPTKSFSHLVRILISAAQ